MQFALGLVIALALCSLIPTGTLAQSTRSLGKGTLVSDLAGERNDRILSRDKRSSEGGHWHYGGFGGGGGGGGLGAFGVGGGMRGLFWGLALANMLTTEATTTTTKKP
ncbi:hypothetical protein BV898_09128 [Hypsibius exemplaris]|uniref:Uncharacterized protein n=1 Tax=Hypsibius exemplaris TaxID=2072580 RepID=A0A1W0WNM3_HYPEX|nr:hypothetical protein BV898_09128 [Hypsibius exemplaris]